MSQVTLNVNPVSKPRMTRSDKWKERPEVMRYWAYKDLLNAAVKASMWVLGDTLDIEFWLPMPESWSAKKKERMRGTPHQQKPDLDNLTKAFKDALLKDDSRIYYERVAKYWHYEGKIQIYL